MAAKVPEKELVGALVDYVENGAYPNSEHVASAMLPKSALPALLDGVRKGQEAVKVL
jgi:centromere/kinetochore protein ZW10